jgi:hypothetical protein
MAGGSIASELSIINGYLEDIAGKALASSTASLSLDEGDVAEVLNGLEVPDVIKVFLNAAARTIISAIIDAVRLAIELVKGGISIKDALLFASEGICLAILGVANVFLLGALGAKIAVAFSTNAAGMDIIAAAFCAWFYAVVSVGLFLLKGLLLKLMIQEAESYNIQKPDGAQFYTIVEHGRLRGSSAYIV